MDLISALCIHCGIPPGLSIFHFDAWTRTSHYLGPSEHTPLKAALEYKTSAALMGILYASAAWCYERTKAATDAAVLRQLCEAIFCFCLDFRYLNPVEKFRSLPLTNGLSFPEGVKAVYPWIFFGHHFIRPGRWPVYPPVAITARAINLTRHAMPKDNDSYDRWLEPLVAHLDSIARLNDPRFEPLASKLEEDQEAEARRVLGVPLSPWALDPGSIFDADHNAAALDDHLQRIEWSRNQFLRSPAELHALGFVGHAYRYPP